MKSKIIFCSILFVSPIFLFAAGDNFTRILSLGMRGSDVRELQKILNADKDTRIADIGSGSPGNETDYFGPATRRALVKFQEKYREDILTSSKLASGTGIFGAKTREKVHTLFGGALVASKSNTTTIATAVAEGEVIVMFPSQYSGKPGTMITISGAGFTDDNTIYFGQTHAVIKAVSSYGQSITLRVPAIQKGVYSLFVKNSHGESNKDAFFVVTDGVTPEPKIDNVEPVKVTRGKVITVKGSGFVATGNTVRAGSNIIENTPSADGSSLTFVVPDTIFMATTTPSRSVKKVLLPIWVFVVNENGVSNGKSFDLEI